MKFLTILLWICLFSILSSCGGSGSKETGNDPPPGPSPVYPRYLYVVNGDDTLSAFAIENQSGRLRHRGFSLTGLGGESLALDASGQYILSANRDENSLSAFKINGNGFLDTIDMDGTIAGIQNIATGNQPAKILSHPIDPYLYVLNAIDNTISQFHINQSNGVLTEITPRSDTDNQPTDMIISHDGHFAYVIHGASQNIFGFTINAANGQLSPIGPTTGGAVNSALVIHPNGQYLYVADQTNGNILKFSINGTTGELSNQGSFVAGTDPVSLGITPSGEYAYALNAGSETLNVYQVSQVNGDLIQIKILINTGATPSKIRVDPSGQYIYVLHKDSIRISSYSIDQTTGVPQLLTSLSDIAAKFTPLDLIISKGNSPISITPKFLYSANQFDGAAGNSISQYSINSDTGAITELGDLPSVGRRPYAVTADPFGRYAFVAHYFRDQGDFADKGVTAYSINASTGLLTEINTLASGIQPYDITIDPSGRFVYTANSFVSENNIGHYAVDGDTGALSFVSFVPAGTSTISIQFDPTGQFAFATNSNSNEISVYRMDPVSGELLPIDSDPTTVGIQHFATGLRPYDSWVDPTGSYLYVVYIGGLQTFSINRRTGELTEIDSDQADPWPYGVSGGHYGQYVYVANWRGNVSAYTVQADGLLNIIDSSDASPGIQHFAYNSVAPTDIMVDPSNRFAYVASWGNNMVASYRVNPVNGFLEEINTAAAGEDPHDLAIVADWQ